VVLYCAGSHVGNTRHLVQRELPVTLALEYLRSSFKQARARLCAFALVQVDEHRHNQKITLCL
jgi:hypothetical protein